MPASSFRIVPVAVAPSRTRCSPLVSFTLNVSSCSATVSPLIATEKFWVVLPGGNTIWGVAFS